MPGTPSRGTHPRITRQHSRARLAATDAEHEELDRLLLAVEEGAISMFEASQTLRALLRQQHERQQEQRAA